MQEFASAASARADSPELRKLLRGKLNSVFRTDQKSFYWNHLQGSDGDYLFVVNDLRVPGPMYGRFGKVAEQGVPQRVRFDIANSIWRYAYDLLTQKSYTIEDGGLTLTLPPCGGAVLLFAKNRIGELTGNINSLRQLSLQMDSASGLIPVRVEIILPDGSVFLDQYDVLTNGRLTKALGIPINAPDGDWLIRATELASGQTIAIPFRP